MKSFYPPESYYDIDECSPREYFKASFEEKKQDAAEFMNDLVKQLYNDEPIDKCDLENCLDELCHYFNIRLNEGDLYIQKQPKKVLKYA